MQQRALQRSEKRLEVTSKRVRDGLNEKADLYSAQIDHVSRREQLAAAQFALDKSLNDLAQKLHRPLQVAEINPVSLRGERLTPSVNYSIQENLDIKRFKAQVSSLNRELENLKRNYFPRVTLSAAYTDNTGNMGNIDGPGGEDGHSIALNLNMPLTLTQEKLNVARKKVEILSSEMDRKQILEQLSYRKKNLENEIATQLKSLNFSRQRIELSHKNLKERNRLYGIGRADFDGLIQAEENLINTERSYVNHWFQYESTIAKKASLHAKLLETIRGKNR